MNKWQFVATSAEGDSLIIEGIDVWQQPWQKAPDELASVRASGQGERLSLPVYEILADDKRIAFAAAEVSNGIWEFYIPARLRPWGVWLTLVFSLIVIGTKWLLEANSWPSFCWLARSLNVPIDDEWLRGNFGLFVAVNCWVTAVVTLGLLAMFTRARRGWTISKYWALNRISWKSLGGWLVVGIVFIIVSEWAVCQMRGYLVSEWAIVLSQTARFPPLLWTALVIAAPVSEEVLFRGFMYRGIQGSRLGKAGAIVLPALVWGLLHMQYDWYRIAALIISGVFLGTARLQSDSAWPPIAIHSLNNFISFFEVAWVLR